MQTSTSTVAGAESTGAPPDDIIARVEQIVAQTRQLYLEDDLPWVVGYSGGKDSTATLQLVWLALLGLPEERRTKSVHVISTDTLVENPIVARWVERSLDAMNVASHNGNMRLHAHRLTPELRDRFWVNLIGKGYPAPRPKFRWCTSRLKISASNKFIRDVADSHGEAILVLGSRSGESGVRKRVMENYAGSTRSLLSRNGDPSLDRVWVYTPIADWSSDDVWEFLVTVENPWGYSNRALLEIYRGATPDAECPLVVDSSTPSCGDSRFGCFVCTLVDKDKSMQAMIQNDEEKRWMIPLADFRNTYLDVKEDRKHRDFRRMDGSLTVFQSSKGPPTLVHGPYKQRYRETLLRALLQAQVTVQTEARQSGKADLESFELIGLEELEEIRKIWIKQKHEIEDRLPRIYEEATGLPYPRPGTDDNRIFSSEEVELLRSIAHAPDDADELHFQLLRELLHVEQSYRTASRRAGIYEAFDKALERGAFTREDEALAFALLQHGSTTPEMRSLADFGEQDELDLGARADQSGDRP
jgi:DNA sulfur modification protein DndC